MLNRLKTFAAVAVVAMAFVGCTKEETSMSINDLPGRAKVKGNVYYNHAQKYIRETETEDAMLKDLYESKAEVKVLAKIDNALVSGDPDAGGYTIFETVTDAEGRYEFEIPVPEDGLDIELQVLPFEGVRNSFDSLYRKEPKFSDKAGVFEYGEEMVTLFPNDIKSQDIKCEFTPNPNTELEENAADNFKKTVLRVNVYKGVYSYSSPYFLPSDLELKVTITDGNNIDQSEEASEKGIAEFEILHTTDRNVELTVTVTSLSGTTSLRVPYYYNAYNEEMSGTYRQFYSTDEKWENKDIAQVWKNGQKEAQTVTVSPNGRVKTVNVYMMFEPDSRNSGFNGVYDEQYYEEWVTAYFNNY